MLNQIDGLGDICGSDSEGRKAASDFQNARDKFTTYAGALADGYVGVATRLCEMAANVAVADWNSIAALPKVDQSVPIAMPTI
ncbi:hypothetical protein [Actinoallomurus sp. CA-150999]|uniref:hypothetical protein n=1 Tax=Actinoallomurus sp. CA-150999 TaxID=3239887 RepID=UPI003D8D3FD5